MSSISVLGVQVWESALGWTFFFQIVEVSGREIGLMGSVVRGVKMHWKFIGIVGVVVNSGVVWIGSVTIVIVGKRLQSGGLFTEIFLNSRSIDRSL